MGYLGEHVTSHVFWTSFAFFGARRVFNGWPMLTISASSNLFSRIKMPFVGRVNVIDSVGLARILLLDVKEDVPQGVKVQSAGGSMGLSFRN